METTCTDTLVEFRDALQRMVVSLDAHIKGPFWVVGINVDLLAMANKNRIAMRRIRAYFDACEHSCAQCECLSGIAPHVAAVRDTLAGVASYFGAFPVLWFVRRRLLAALDDWDDLADECLVGGDPDIRSDLNALASLL